MPQAIATTDHGTIQRWAETRKGHPALVKRTENLRGGGVLRIDFEPPEESLDPISWDQFFEVFDENNLAFLYQEKTDSGRPSRFNKFVSRDSVEAADEDEETDTPRSAKKNAAPAGNAEDEADDEDADFDEDDEDFDDDEDEDTR